MVRSGEPFYLWGHLTLRDNRDVLEVSDVARTETTGLFVMHLQRAMPSLLIRAMDPDTPWVAMPAGGGEKGVMAFATREFVLTPERHDSGLGRLRCWQVTHLPERSIEDVPAGRSRSDWYREKGVVLSFDLPHNDTVAVIASPEREPLEAARRRLLG